MTVKEFRDVLCGLEGVEVFHKEAHKSSDNYIVWNELGGLSLDADGNRTETGMRISVGFYTKQEYSVIPTELELMLCEYDDICLDGPEIDYEEDTGFTHYEYLAEVYGGGKA